MDDPGGAPQLRREVSAWSSFMWGYADVGADIYVALGLVIAAAQGAAPAAFALAGLVYIMIGLGYTELASAYPVAGGGHYFALRGLGDFWGFVAGMALLLDYTVNIALFTVASAGYFNFFWPMLFGAPYVKHTIPLGPFTLYDPVIAGQALALILLLVVVNLRGLKPQSWFTELLGAVDIIIESSLIMFGFVIAWKPEVLMQQWHAAVANLSLHDFAYGSSLAIISYVGLEAISQAAQEAKRPATLIPRTSITLIFTVFIFAMALSSLSLGMLRWETFLDAKSDSVAVLAHNLPWIGVLAGPLAAFLGVLVLAVSASSGIRSASRLTFSMSRLRLITRRLDRSHFRSAVVLFSLVGALEVVLAAFTPDVIDTLANLYAFGASLGYILVFIALIRLRFSDPYTPRPYRIPLNLPWKRSDGSTVAIPLLGFVGLLGVSIIFFEVVYTHRIGRLAGPAWIGVGLVYYFVYRVTQKLPIFGSVKRDWEAEQIAVMTDAEEFDLLERYKNALKERDKIVRDQPHGH
jgi:basic amino acid/polyamine antiporter, APA family